ncbi:VOC family protein [Jatrophihabitans fulvus]
MTNQDATARIGSVMYPVADVDRAVTLYRAALGLDVAFVDGDRYASLRGDGGSPLALAGPPEQVAGDVAAACFKVDSVAAAVARATDAGATVARAAETGPHETRAVLRDLDGNAFVVYGPA